MKNAVTTKQMQAIENLSNELGVSYFQLMENAGTACAKKYKEINHSAIPSSVVILCGNGNNGGDGLVIARILSDWDYEVTIIFCKGEPNTEISQQMYEKVKANNEIQTFDAQQEPMVSLFHIKQADVIFDCIFGTGFHGQIEPSIARMIEGANQSAALKIAVDIPSGISGDSGEYSDAVFQADYTFALGALKKVHTLPSCQHLCGTITTLDIGIPKEAIDQLFSLASVLTFSDLTSFLPKRDDNANKGDFGKLLIVAGKTGMGGAAMMATLSAMRCGCGLTTLAAAKNTVQYCFPHLMEAITLPLKETLDGAISTENISKLKIELSHSTACVIGCGLGRDDSVVEIVKALVENSEIPLVLDADGINALASDINIVQTAKAPIILTPHPKEFSRLTGKSVAEIENNREEMAIEFARTYSVILVLKGHKTLIALPDGTLYENSTGNAGMAKGGSGDVLSGMIGSFLAQGIKPDHAVRLAVCLHGAAGDECTKKFSEYGVLARDLIDELPALLRKIELERDKEVRS